MDFGYISIVSMIGFFMSIYFYRLTKKVESNGRGKAVCDISKGISCTKVIKTKYNRLFGIPNALLGVGFYLIVFLLATYGFYNYLFWIEIVAVVMSVALIYFMFKVRMICVVCVLIHILNFLLLWLSYLKVY